MRLIDADDFYERMNNDTDLCAEMESDGIKSLKKYLDLQPTAYDVEKVVEELEKQAEEFRSIAFKVESQGFSDMADKCYAKQSSYLKTIEIVKQGGVSDDVCEWELDGVYLHSPHKPLVSCVDEENYRYYYCPVCGKKIKAVE